jgi:hypothetical protein
VDLPGHDPAEPCCALGDGHADTPRWESETRTLWLGAALVKQFKQPAADQEAVLAAFDEAHWARKIDDPMPHNPKVAPKTRVHFTIRHLNYQEYPCLKFFGDGTGEAFCWARLCAALSWQRDAQHDAPPPH